MALSTVQKLASVGFSAEQAQLINELLNAIAVTQITNFAAEVNDAVSEKTEIAALTGSSTAANIVTALQA
jgi:hypothetical protein